MVLISEVGAVQSTAKERSTKSKKAPSYHYPDDIIRLFCVVNNIIIIDLTMALYAYY